METTVNQEINKEELVSLNEKFYNKDLRPLDDIFAIEHVAVEIYDICKKKDYYKAYKKKKMEDINREIKKLENKEKFFRETILLTLDKEGEKNIDFPGTCRISKTKSRSVWDITDEEAFIEKLKEKKEYDNVVEEITELNIIKTEANKLLNEWEKNDQVPLCVSKQSKSPTISITYKLDTEKKLEVKPDNFKVIKKEKKEGLTHYDGLEI